MREGTFFETLPCELTEAEKHDRGRDLAAAHEALSKHLDDAAEAKKALEKRENEIRKEMSRLSRARHTGVEDRDVECYQQPNTASYTIETIRIDTGEVIFSRDMDPMERNQAMQGELPFNNPSVRRAVRAARAKDDAVYPLRPVTDLDDDEIEAGAAGHDDEVGGDDEGGDPVDFKPLPEKRFDPSDDDDLPIMTEEGEPE